MTELELYFEDSPWNVYLDGLKPGEAASGAMLLTLSEDEGGRSLEDALQELEERGIDLDISQLPVESLSGEAAVRLKLEGKLAHSGLKPESLPEEDPLRVYLEEVARIPRGQDLAPLLQRSAAGEEAAREELTGLCLPSVVDIAREYAGRGVLLLDLIQEGSLGLWQAVCGVEQWDFLPRSERLIRFYMARAVLIQAQNNGLGQKMRRALEDYQAVDERLLGELGRNPTLEEIAEQLHIPVEAAEVVRKNLDDARILARVKKVPEPEEEELAQTQAVEDTAYFQMRQRIRDLLSNLEETDRQLLTLRYGLEGDAPMTAETAGARLGLTPEEVLARETGALAKLRENS